MSETRKPPRQALVEKFQTIAVERLGRLNGALLELEKDPDNEPAAALAQREIHTLKGEAKLMGFADINLVAHKTEDLLLFSKERGFRVQSEVVESILKGFDIIGHLLHKQVGTASTTVDLSAFVAHIDELVKGVSAAQAPAATTLTTPPPAAGSTEPSPAAAARGPAAASTTPATVRFEAPRSEEVHESLVDLKRDTSIRVGVDKVDRLTDLVGDLLRHQQQTQHTFLSLAKQAIAFRKEVQALQAQIFRAGPLEWSERRQLALALQDVSRGVAQLGAGLATMIGTMTLARERVSAGGDRLNELEGSVRDLRLLPLATLFGRYPRAIRDMAREHGKQVTVTMFGTELELDKNVLDQLGEPLLHLVRNAVDHGIESPEVRRGAGKPEVGTITLSARQATGRVEVAVSDDGAGVDPQRIKTAALARGLFRETDLEQMSNQELLLLPFQRGFSTREQATDMSGRGIGLDIVKQRVEELGGMVALRSVPGKHTAVVLSVPISVAITRALVVQVGRALYALPSHAVEGVVEVKADQLEAVGAGHGFRHEGVLVPLHDFAALVGRPAPPSSSEQARAVLVQVQDRSLALRVEAVVGERELVQRPLDPFLEGISLLVGTAVLEHAEATLIVNVPELVRAAGRAVHVRQAAGATRKLARERCVLLAEDSELTRDMLAGLVRELGHLTMEAANGRDAIERLNERKPDLVITDLEMPIMDGFAVIAEVRNREALRDVPIIVVSTRGSESDKQRAIDLGANGYVVKSEFREADLIKMVTRFLPPEDH